MKDEIRLVCLGRSTPASRLVPIGIARVDVLRQVGDYAAQHVNVSDVDWFHVRISGGNATLTIYEDGEGGGACLPYQSGMTQFGISAEFNKNSANPFFRFWAFQPSIPYASRLALPLEWQASDYGQVQYTQISSCPTLFDPGPGAFLPNNASGRYWAQTALLKPSLYSGKMRHVVQILLGSNVAIPYDFRFSRTHGLFVGKKDQGPNDWVVEISAQKGVLAMKLPKCNKVVPSENTLGYVPTGEPFPDEGNALSVAIKDGAVRVLMGPEGLAEVYRKSPFSEVLGWAFDYSGSKASCVVSDTSGQYRETFLYTIHIPLSLDGGPGAAHLSLDETGFVVGEGYNQITMHGKCMFKVTSRVGGASFPVWLGPLSGEYEPASCRAPLHVWYEAGGRRRVVWFESGVRNSSRPPDENPLPPECSTYEGWVKSGIGFGGQEFIDYPPGSGGDEWNHLDQVVYIDDYKPPSDQFSPLRTVRYAFASSSYVEDLSGMPRWPWHAMSMQALKLARFHVKNQTNYSRYVNSSVVVPAFEREAALFHNSTTESTEFSSYAYVSYIIRGATAAYDVNLPHNPEIEWQETEDGLLIGVELKDTGDDSTSSNWEIVLSLAFEDMKDFGSWTSGGFTPPNSSLGGSSVDAYLVTPSKYSHAPKRENLSGVKPFTFTETHGSARYRRSFKKSVVGAFGVIDLESSYPFDSFEEATSGPTDPAWFSFVDVSYPLIQSWDASLRYSPPQLDNPGFEKSSFGSYKKPFLNHYFSINFVGDA